MAIITATNLDNASEDLARRFIEEEVRCWRDPAYKAHRDAERELRDIRREAQRVALEELWAERTFGEMGLYEVVEEGDSWDGGDTTYLVIADSPDTARGWISLTTGAWLSDLMAVPAEAESVDGETYRVEVKRG